MKEAKSMITNLKASSPKSKKTLREVGLAVNRLKMLKTETGMSEQRLMVKMINFAYEHDPSLREYHD